jgi:SIR2-like domain
MSVKRKLIIVAGAGSSIDFGMLQVEEVNSFFLKSAQQYFLLANDHNKNLYGYIYDEVERQLSCNTMLGQRRKPKFEDILYVIYTLAGLHSAQAPLGAFIGIRRFPDVVYIGQLKRVDEHMLSHLGQHLVDSLLDALRKQCQEPASHFAELKNLLAALAEEFDVALVTTNYDDLLYRAFPQGIETGFDLGNNGVFCQDRILRRATWPCILHLHGSVHFDMDHRRDDFHAIHWREDLTRFHQNSFGRNPQYSVEGNVFPTSSIIAGYGKTIQVQRFPFRTYYSELDRLVYGSDAS